MQEVGIHTMAPAAELAKDPLPHSVAIHSLRELATASQNGGPSLPPGAGRFVVTVDGTESEEEIKCLKGSQAAMVLLQVLHCMIGHCMVLHCWSNTAYAALHDTALHDLALHAPALRAPAVHKNALHVLHCNLTCMAECIAVVTLQWRFCTLYAAQALNAFILHGMAMRWYCAQSFAKKC